MPRNDWEPGGMSLGRWVWRTVSTNVGILGWVYATYLAVVYWLLPALMRWNVPIPVWFEVVAR
jgi:hypothetical protein